LDVLQVLRDSVGLIDDDRVEIRIGPLRLPSNQVVGLVQVFFDVPGGQKIYIVSLPTSTQFKAHRPGCSKRTHFDIRRLDGATADSRGEVVLSDGTILRAVEIIPARLFVEPSDLDWRIVHHTISIIGAEERCYRHLGHGLPLPYCDMVPDMKVLDCSKLHGLKLPSLKHIAGQIAHKDWTLKKLSQQKIADTLREFGMRFPARRPRVGFRQTPATI
jgi:hypothetical protein